MSNNGMAQESHISLTIGNEDVKAEDCTKGETVDVNNRDPNNVNQYLKVLFHDIFAEPDVSIFSFDKVWEIAFKVFTNSKLWCYRILSLLCGIPAALLWGINFACIAFCHIWCCMPCMKLYEVDMVCIKKFWFGCLDTFMRPCYENMGYLFYNIRVFVHKE